MSDADFDPHKVPVRPAATVMLVRDGDAGLEVFMLRRTAAAVFAAGMYVFPGGKLDEADASGVVFARCAGRTDDDASKVLAIPSGGLSYWVAAIRETFEEAGVLLAVRAGEVDAISFDDEAIATKFNDLRHDVHAGRLTLGDLCVAEDLTLRAGQAAYVSRWITPVGQARRFDTRFFVARAPEFQVPLHDEHETVDSLWVRPVDALARFRAGELGMFHPTVSNLEFLAQFDDADVAIAAALAGERSAPIPTILPKVRVDGEGQVVALLMPGDDGYDEAPDYAVVA